ncbi:MAG: C_GCAxxG_C_C family protein, partial [Clostridiales bacterium]|nr:C_GCAxxG_C_C family protein [Clostridiales bacterium]
MQEYKELVASRVHEYYWEYDWNCATTVLRILAAIDGIELNEQVLAAAVGMHGAGRYGAQCGLVEGGLMYLGIRYYEELGPGAVEKLCYRLA